MVELVEGLPEPRKATWGGGWRGSPFPGIALTESSLGFHFRWKSLVLHFRSVSSMMSTWRRNTKGVGTG